ncbi:MAG: RNA polymerase sigma factor [Lachnospiraceae bacterium]|nr:RNA polymerase sigma factor [Lachnospiraceae bacterium]
MENDDELYERFLAGDTAAYDELMIRHGSGLVLFLYGYLRNREDAEDMMIETFARLMVKKPNIRKDGFRAYLYKTARNMAARFHYNRSRSVEESIDDMEELTDGLRPDDALLDEDKQRTLHICLGRIEPELREVLQLVYIENMSYAEAAAVLGVKVKRVDHLLARAKEHMRRELEKEGITSAGS